MASSPPSVRFQIKSRHINITLPVVVGTVPLCDARSPVRPSAPELRSPPADPWRRSPHGSPAGTWGRSPRPSPRHSPAPEPHSASAPALAAAQPAPGYDPPPSYEQVMQGRPHAPSGEYMSEKQRRKEAEASGLTHLGDL